MMSSVAFLLIKKKDNFSSFSTDQIPNEWLYFSQSGAAIRPGIVHRLDKGTSGLLVVAKVTPRSLDNCFYAPETRKLPFCL